MLLKIKIFLIFLFIYSCQPIEIVAPIEIDNSKLEKISISAKDLLLNIKYNPIFSENNIEDKINNPPIEIITSWINENISNFGNNNTFVINIIDAYITKKEIDNTDSQKYSEKTVFQYEVFFLIEYELLDDSGFLIANNSVPDANVPPAVAIPVNVVPLKDEPGEYIIFSPVSKKWSITVNSPVPKFKAVAGLNFFSNICIVLLCNK